MTVTHLRLTPIRQKSISRWTRNRGQSPRDRVAECLGVSVAGGRFDREIERFEGLCPVVKAPWCASLLIIHRWWRFAYHRLMAWIPPVSRCGMPLERGNLLNPFRKLFSRIGQCRPDRTRTSGTTLRQGRGRAFPSLGSR